MTVNVNSASGAAKGSASEGGALMSGFAVGDQVRLRNCAGPSGTVKGIKRAWVLVKWIDQPRVMRHRPGSLVAAGEVDTQPAKENRYLKMLRRIDADNNKRSDNS